MSLFREFELNTTAFSTNTFSLDMPFSVSCAKALKRRKKDSPASILVVYAPVVFFSHGPFRSGKTRMQFVRLPFNYAPTHSSPSHSTPVLAFRFAVRFVSGWMDDNVRHHIEEGLSS